MDELAEYHALWAAVLGTMVLDALDHAAGRSDPQGELRAAFEDLRDCGPMTRRLAGYSFADPERVTELFLASMDRQRGQRRRKIGIGY